MRGPWAGKFGSREEISGDSSGDDGVRDAEIATKRVSKSKGRNIKFSEADKLIPSFDGKNISVLSFIRQIENTYKLIKKSERVIYLNLVRSRIKGEADIFIGEREFEDLGELCAELKRAYAPSRNVSQWQSDMARITQKYREDAFEYGVRVTSTLTRLVESMRENFKDCSEGMVRGAREGAIDSFVRGLHEKLNLRLSGRKFSDLQEAINAAVEAESDLDFRYTIRSEARGTKPSPRPEQARVSYAFSRARTGPEIDYRGRSRDDYRYTHDNRDRNYTGNFNYDRKRKQDTSFSDYNSKHSHDDNFNKRDKHTHSCYYNRDNPNYNYNRNNRYNDNNDNRNYNDHRNRNDNQDSRFEIDRNNGGRSGSHNPHADKRCDKCRKMGHIAANCRSDYICNFCGISGHVFNECRKRKAARTESGNSKVIRGNDAVANPGRTHLPVSSTGPFTR